MKKQFFKTANIKVYTSALMVSFLLLTGFQSQAAGNDFNQSDAKITYVGTESNLLAFNIDFKNVEESPFIVELTDDFGHLLFKKKYTGKMFNKNIFLKNIGDLSRVNFTIKAGKKVVNQTFNIATQVKMVEDVVVTKL